MKCGALFKLNIATYSQFMFDMKVEIS